MQVTDPEAAVSFRPGELEITPDGSGHLLGTACGACGSHYFPARSVCARCSSDDMATTPLSTEGVLYTFTVIRQSTPRFEVPYVLGYVDLPEGVRVMGQITGVEPDAVTIGMPLRLRIEPWGEDDDGTPLVGYRFHPFETEEHHD